MIGRCVWTACVPWVATHDNFISVFVDIDGRWSTRLVVAIAWWRQVMQTILHGHVFARSVAGIEAIFWRYVINTMVPGIGWLVIRVRMGLRGVLLVYSATLLFVASTLRATHTRTTTVRLITRYAHVSMVL
jgi:nucleoside recognition membrane protein YjiH